MSEDKALRKPEKKKATFLTKTVDFFRRLPGKLVQPFKNMWRELKNVTWPSRKSLLNYTLIVMGFMVFMGIVIGLLDMGASKLIALMVG
ncbi:MAG: preprotein translocase subunit SecE [Clostridiales bacterium]|jgi:preprotein translocase SecE subunit|nr:preprotein translocase subunit SecE [Clostridiales bacterium]